jgi:MFS family permease
LKDKLDQYHSDGSEIGKPGRSGKGIGGYFRKTFVSFQHPVYRFYFVAMAGHWSAMSMQTVARSQLAYVITGSGAVLGMVSLANAIPMLLLSLPGGSIADKVQKKTVVQLSQAGSAAINLMVTIMLISGYLGPSHPESWWILVVGASLQGAVMGIQMPSRQAIISDIVGDEHLMNAISLNNLGMNVFRIFMPGMAGFIIDAFGYIAIYSVMTVFYLIAVISMAFVPASPVLKKARSGSTLSEITDAWRYVRSEKIIYAVLIFSVFATILGMPYVMLLPMFTTGIFNLGASGMGILITLSGIGAVLGSFVMASLGNRNRGKLLLVFSLIMGTALLGFAFSRWWYLSLFLMMFVGAGNTVQVALGNSLIQYYADANYRGRVLSFFLMGFGLGSLGAFFAGILAEAVGVQWAIGGMAFVLLVITAMMFLTAPGLRKLD